MAKIQFLHHRKDGHIHTMANAAADGAPGARRRGGALVITTMTRLAA